MKFSYTTNTDLTANWTAAEVIIPKGLERSPASFIAQALVLPVGALINTTRRIYRVTDVSKFNGRTVYVTSTVLAPVAIAEAAAAALR